LNSLKGKVLCEGDFGQPGGKQNKMKLSYSNEGKIKLQVADKGYEVFKGPCER